MLNKIRECAVDALTDSEAVADQLTNTCEAQQKGQREAVERTLAKDGERIDVLEKMVLRLYEDMVAGRITEENFNLLLEKTQIKEIVVHEAIDSDKTRHISIEIHFNLKSIPEVEQVTG